MEEALKVDHRINGYKVSGYYRYYILHKPIEKLVGIVRKICIKFVAVTVRHHHK